MRAPAAAVVALLAVACTSGCGSADRRTDAERRVEIAALEKESEALRGRIEALGADDPWSRGMPDSSVRIGVPTTLAASLIQRVAASLVDRVTIELGNLRVRRRGQVRKVITLGDYDLRVTVNRVTARLKTETPKVTFGANRIAVSLPIGVVSGSGRATVNLKWNGRSIGGAVCGDQDVTQVVTGGVWPDRYTLTGALSLSATPQQILVEPIFPRTRIKVRVKPSGASWAAAQKILDDKSGVCGFVLDRVNVMAVVQRVIDRGFDIRLPTEKVKPVALPVGLNPSVTVRGETLAMGIRVSDLAISEQMFWLGAEVTVGVGAR